MNRTRAEAGIILAGVLWGTMSLFTRGMGRYGVTPLQIAFLRSAASALLLLIYLGIRDPGALKIRLKDLWMFAGTGIISLSLFNLCYFTVIEKGEASIAVSLLYTSPAFVILFSAVLFYEPVTGKKIAALILVLAGSVLVSGMLQQSGKLSLPLFITGIGSGLFYGLYSIFSRYALEKYDFMTVVFYTFVLSGIGLLPFCGAAGTAGAFFSHPPLMLLTAGIAIFATILPYLFYTMGLKYVESGRAAVLVTSEIVMGTLIGIVIFRETAGFFKILGILCIFAAVVILNTGFDTKPAGEVK